MAAIVRVKRRVSEDPVDSLVISCKRLKKDDENTSISEVECAELRKVFKFAATVPDEVCTVSDNLLRFVDVP